MLDTDVVFIMAIETAMGVCSVALGSDQEFKAEYRLNAPARHTEILVPLLERMLKDSGVSWSEIAALAVSVGPGSFTGLRIGITTAKTLAYGLKKPLLAVPTLAALAAQLPGVGMPVCSLLDARREEVCFAIYRTEQGFPEQVLAPQVGPFALLEPVIVKPTLFVGEGVLTYRKRLVAHFGKRAHFVPLSFCSGGAAGVLTLGLDLFKKQKWADPFQLEPVYFRSFG